ncbi:hypothetical protein SUGI_0062880 [Cryptomeria japonica]|uniref:uncharacterized protein LOC131073511 n=1 Tax=Cryptomeria japonica TaxID=3369 RepID=UPI002408ACC0|nr:uncharacterized protein LOC131073511 [Cryptomeria japonica]GLJ07252.1 hypothetical protein SUGI_0062880 [Cryptomeria japonica]
MPVISAHCFANHRGGVGKTTLAYQVSSAYAAAHPGRKVLVIDTTDSGDLSEMLMGGIYEKRGREMLRSLIPVANVTQMFLRALVASTSTSLSDVLKAEEYEDGVLTSVVQKMPLAKGAVESSPLEKAKVMKRIDLEEFGIPLKQVNSRMPSNMFLCPSGLDIEHSISFSATQRQDIIAVLLDSFQNAEGEWKVFIDTDTELYGENGAYANIGFGIADFICLPLHADMSDWYGAKVLINDMQLLHDMDVSHAQVHLVLWNGLNVQFKQSCGVTVGGISKCTFIPTKAEQDIIQTLDNLVYQEAQIMPNLFLHYNGAKTTAEEFSAKCSTCMRNFGVVGVASKDIGVPIACIKPGIFHGVHMDYNLSIDTIKHCRENLEEIVKAIDQVDEKNNPRKICRQHLEFLKARRMERKLGIKLKLKHKSPLTTVKKRRRHSASSASKDTTSVMYKTYALRNRYSLRERSKQMKAKLFIDNFESSSISTA